MLAESNAAKTKEAGLTADCADNSQLPFAVKSRQQAI
jgi:hypothetical protein